MKRAGSLFEKIVSFRNLLQAAYRARRGKKNRPDVAAFHFDLERNLLQLQQELVEDCYFPGAYRSFFIHDPKKRLISAAPYRDRIVHHALCQVMENVFEPTFIFDSYANRIGKGTHRALDRCTWYSRRFRYALKCDIEKYFPSMDHEILYEQIRRKIKCRRTCALIQRIIRHSNEQEEIIRYFPGDNLLTPLERRRGIPIGNLTSQFFANIFLNGFDHFITEQLQRDGYIRFVDDFLLFSDDKKALQWMLAQIRDHLAGLRLTLHGRKCQIYQIRRGVPFLGWQVFPDHRRLIRKSGIRIQHRLQALHEAYASGEKDLTQVRCSVMSYRGHLQHGDTWGLRKKWFAMPFLRTQPTGMNVNES